jgi:hypothetical protein
MIEEVNCKRNSNRIQRQKLADDKPFGRIRHPKGRAWWNGLNVPVAALKGI